LSGGATVRSLRNLISRLGSLRQAEDAQPGADSEPEDTPVVTSKALQRFLAHLGTRPAPVLLDLGPVVGSNISYFGERLNCRFLVENLFDDLDRHARDAHPVDFAAFLSKRLTLHPGTVDGVLVWDLYDYLDRPSAQALATMLARLLRADGALLGFFGNANHAGSTCAKFVVVDDSHVRQRPYASALVRKASLQNRDIIRMFDGMHVTDSYLLQAGWREMLFRKGRSGRPIT